MSIRGLGGGGGGRVALEFQNKAWRIRHRTVDSGYSVALRVGSWWP